MNLYADAFSFTSKRRSQRVLPKILRRISWSHIYRQSALLLGVTHRILVFYPMRLTRAWDGTGLELAIETLSQVHVEMNE